MDQLEHDPRTKQQIKNALYAFLYEPVQRSFKTRIDTLIVRNTILGGYTHKHYIYKGVLYNAEPTVPPIKKNRLNPQLKAPMEDYLRDLEQLNSRELPYVLSFLNQVLNSSCDIQDYLQVLPESMHDPLRVLMATCPCRRQTLSTEKVEQLKTSNEETINLMKQRLVTNLLLN